MRLKDLAPIDPNNPVDKQGILVVDTEDDCKTLPLASLLLNGAAQLEMTADNGDKIVLKVVSFKGEDGKTYYSLDPVKKA